MENIREPATYQSPLNGPPPTVRYATDRKDMIATVILLVLCLAASNFTIYGGFHLGFAVGFVLLAVASAGYLWCCGRWKPTGYSVFCFLSAIAGAGVYVWHNDGDMHALLVCALLYLVMQSLVVSTDSVRRDTGTVGAVADTLAMLIVRPFQYMGKAIPALFRTQREGQTVRRRCGGILLGLLCALPVVGILLPLLIDADAAFEGLMEEALRNHLGEVVATLAAGCFLFAFVYTRTFSLRHRMGHDRPLRTTAVRRVDRMALNAFLGVIVGLYAVFLLSQLAYFTSAFAGILPVEYTVAQYARRGFFEMCIIDAINLGLVAVVLLLSHKENEKAPLSTRILCLCVLVFSLGFVVVSLAKMGLYVGSFGMTRLRIFTSVFMLMLGTAIIGVGIRLFAPRYPYMRTIVVAVTLISLAMSYADVDTVIARYNVEAYRRGALETVDVYELGRLSDGAVPYLLELCDDPNEEVARQAVETCVRKLPYGVKHDIRAYNVDSRRAQTLLTARQKELESRHEAYLDEDRNELQEDRYLNRDRHLKVYLGEYANTQDISSLGEVAIRNTRNTATVYHAYYRNSRSEAETTLGGYTIYAHYLCKPYDMGIYIVTDEKVFTLTEAYMYNTVYLKDVYALLPDVMKYRTVTTQTYVQ